jgi:hypothetical protein
MISNGKNPANTAVSICFTLSSFFVLFFRARIQQSISDALESYARIPQRDLIAKLPPRLDHFEDLVRQIVCSRIQLFIDQQIKLKIKFVAFLFE